MSEENLDKKESDQIVEDAEISTSETAESDETEASPRRKFFVILGVVLLVFVLIGLYFYLERNRSASETPAETKEETVVSVKVATAEKQTIAQEFTAIGTVAPAEQSTVAASISAQIKQMRLLKNQFVKQGEVLAVLASQDLQSQRNEAKAALDEAKLNLETLQKVTIPQTRAQTEKDLSDAKANADNARTTYERRKDLYEKGGLSLKELEASKLALQNAENALRLAQANSKLNASAVNPNARAIAENKIRQAQERINTIDAQANLAEIRAPISGVVTDQFQYEGEFAAQGARLLTISAIGAVIVKANFSDTVVANLQTGDAVTIFLPSAPDERMAGKVTQISRSADVQNRTVEVWANFENGRGLLRAGDSVQFVISARPANDAVVVPVSAVTLDASNSDEGTVMTVDDASIAHETKVKVGIKQGDKIQIIEGLEGGETVVTEGNYALPDGTKVEAAKEEENKDEEK
ncbi:MAG TPA: efflux RND transporter periplasmic adaptor subunit [Pyrinomonadaceae bacterium]|nr:efflux RND transporter periplasmic adaptor subunit [Pyrinomonadaceae bacterium]